MTRTTDLHVEAFEAIESPRALQERFPLSAEGAQVVVDTRQEIRRAIAGDDDRLLVIIGPCSIHDPEAGRDYARRLLELRRELGDRLLIVMRVYFEKPRTTVGWKGLINDPRLDGTCDLNAGLKIARELLVELNALGMPCATEFLDPIVPQYLSDLVSWAAIGARTTESQTHREMASGLSMPVGFKNATDGDLQIALNGMEAARSGHAFLGVTDEGRSCVVRTKGNPDVHLVMRGGKKPNFQKPHIHFAKASLEPLPGDRLILVDCSHGNSNKDFSRQPKAFEYLVDLFAEGERSILGMMVESNIVEGNQPLGGELTYGQSVTDACIGWDTTEVLLRAAHSRLG